MSDETNLSPAPAPAVEKIDQGFVEQFRDKLRFGIERDYSKLEAEVGKHTLAALSNFQPATRSTINRSIGFLNHGPIGTQLLPEVVGAPDGLEQASYPVFGKEALYSGGDDIIGISGEVKRADLGVTWTPVTLDVHGKRAFIDPREARAAQASGVNIYEKKAELIRGQVQAKKESNIATLLTTAGSYLSGHSETLSGTGQWSHTSSTPIAEITGHMETVRAATGSYPTHLWLSPKAFKSLRFHANVTALISYTGTKGDPGAPASLETLAALFNLNVLVGSMVNVTTPAGSMADVWGGHAGLAFVGDGGFFGPQLGFTLTSAGYPKVRTYRSEEQGNEGSEVVHYSEAYKPVVALNTAGYLWINASA